MIKSITPQKNSMEYAERHVSQQYDQSPNTLISSKPKIQNTCGTDETDGAPEHLGSESRVNLPLEFVKYTHLILSKREYINAYSKVNILTNYWYCIC